MLFLIFPSLTCHSCYIGSRKIYIFSLHVKYLHTHVEKKREETLHVVRLFLPTDCTTSQDEMSFREIHHPRLWVKFH